MVRFCMNTAGTEGMNSEQACRIMAVRLGQEHIHRSTAKQCQEADAVHSHLSELVTILGLQISLNICHELLQAA